MKNKYRVCWNDGNEIYTHDRECTYDQLKWYVDKARELNPSFVLESVDKIIEQKIRIDIDGVV